jgi:hypothetical protein
VHEADAQELIASVTSADLHGSRRCHDPEGGPTMGTVDEIPQQPYEEIFRYLEGRTPIA